MKKIEQLTNLKSVSKTLRFRLIPQGKTQQYLEERSIIETDEKLTNDYEKLKEIMTRFHRQYIDSCLDNISLDSLDEYASLYTLDKKSDEQINRMNDIIATYKVRCHDALTNNTFFKNVLFKDEFIKNTLFNWNEITIEEKEIIETFKTFTTYTVGYRENLNNIYTNDNKSTEICFRLFNDNISKFFDNYKNKDKIMEALSESIDEINNSLLSRWNLELSNVFNPVFFNKLLTQQGIDMYNQIIGGISLDDGTKIKGLNEYINLYSQRQNVKIPRLKALFKQVLSEGTSDSFSYMSLSNDDEVKQLIIELDKKLEESFVALNKNYSSLNNYDLNSIYIGKKYFSKISQELLNDWNAIEKSLENQYELENYDKSKNSKKYEENKNKYLKNIDEISLARINSIDNNVDISTYICSRIQELTLDIQNKKDNFDKYNFNCSLMNDMSGIGVIKDYLDSIMNLQHFLAIFSKNNRLLNDEIFYSDLENIQMNIGTIIPIYNKVRNYITKKPYSTDKFKLNFGNSQLLNGWDANKEKDYLSVLLEKNGLFYLAIIDKNNKKVFDDCPIDESDNYQKMYYKLLPGPNKMLPKVIFSASRASQFNPPKELVERYKNGDYKKGNNFDADYCHELIDFFKKCISIHEDWKEFGFKFSSTNSYNSINEFYNEISEQGYKVSFNPISVTYINELVNSGKIFLFEIYNKDFSLNKTSKGKDNLHTIYFKTLFSKENLDKPIIKLNGEAEMFYRRKSIKDNIIIHEKNNPIKNKNILNNKKQSTFTYDLIKDKRFTMDQMFLHLSITLNRNAKSKANVSELVKVAIRNSEKNYVIGIDRGERNLLAISVIDNNGNIVEQFSANLINNKYNNVDYTVDYHQLLDQKEKERKQARESWTSIGKIKDLKEGYLSAVIHEICQLVEKYDAVIALEDLNGGFINSRKKFEKQVYQKFEKMLIDKLSFLVFKDKEKNAPGGVLNAYQLADSSISFGKQNGIIFYVPASLTSKIDPTTGFVNLLHPKYDNIEKSKEFIKKIDSIKYDSSNNMYVITIDYSKFGKEIDYKKCWNIYTNGERIIAFRNKDKNSEWDYKKISLTTELDNLFNKYSIDISKEIKNQLMNHEEKELFESFIRILAFTLQMRNSNASTNEDYIISPVLNNKHEFYDSRNYTGRNACLPIDADTNGAYNIALKGLIMINKINNAQKIEKTDLKISQEEWLQFMQDR